MATDRKPIVLSGFAELQQIQKNERIDAKTLDLTSVEDLERRFRILVKAYINMGFDLPDGLEDDYFADT